VAAEAQLYAPRATGCPLSRFDWKHGVCTWDDEHLQQWAAGKLRSDGTPNETPGVDGSTRLESTGTHDAWEFSQRAGGFVNLNDPDNWKIKRKWWDPERGDWTTDFVRHRQ
jgi:hypothetical protein